MKVFTKFFALSVAKKCGAMRSTFCALLVFCSVVLFQCKDDKKPETPEGVEISISADQTTVTLPAAEGSHKVKITSSGDWNVKEEIPWLEATKADNETLQVSYEKNEGEERTGKVTATIEEESVEITVTQTAGPYFTLQSAEYTLSYEKNDAAAITLDISFFRTAKLWYLSVPSESSQPDWLSAISPDQSAKSNISLKTVNFAIEENIAETDRSFTFELHIENAGDEVLASTEIVIKQTKAVIVVSESDRMPTTSDANAGSQTLTVTTTNGEDWDVDSYQDITDPANKVSDPTWITPTKETAGLKLDYHANTNSTPRMAEIILLVGVDHFLAIYLTQIGNAPVVITVKKYENSTPSAALSSGDALDKVSSEAHTDILLIDTGNGADWTYTGPDWVTFNKIDGDSPSAPDTLEIIYPENENAAQSGAVTITAGDETFIINISQDAPIPPVTITVQNYETDSSPTALSDGDNLPPISSEAHKDTLLIEVSDGTWTAVAGDAWATTQKIDGEAGEADTLEISYAVNNGADRSSTATISAGTGPGAATFTLNLSQRGAPVFLLTVQNYEKGSSPADLSDNDALDEVSANVHTDHLLIYTGDGTAWTHSGEPDWVTLKTIPAVLSTAEDTLEIAYTANDGGDRNSTMSITAASTTIRVNISQNTATAKLSATKLIIPAEPSGRISRFELPLTFEGTPAKWYVVSPRPSPGAMPWAGVANPILPLQEETGFMPFAIDNTSILLGFRPNTGTTARSISGFEIRIRKADDTEIPITPALTFSIEQRPMPPITIERSTEVVAAGATNNLSVALTRSATNWVVKDRKDLTDPENPADNPAWLTAAKASATQLNITCMQNTGDNPRSGIVTLTVTSSDGTTDDVNIAVTQLGTVVITLDVIAYKGGARSGNALTSPYSYTVGAGNPNGASARIMDTFLVVTSADDAFGPWFRNMSNSNPGDVFMLPHPAADNSNVDTLEFIWIGYNHRSVPITGAVTFGALGGTPFTINATREIASLKRFDVISAEDVVVGSSGTATGNLIYAPSGDPALSVHIAATDGITDGTINGNAFVPLGSTLSTPTYSVDFAANPGNTTRTIPVSVHITYPAGTGNGSPVPQPVSQEAGTFNITQRGFFAVADVDGDRGVFGRTEGAVTRYGINTQGELEIELSHGANSLEAKLRSGNTDTWVIDDEDDIPDDPLITSISREGTGSQSRVEIFYPANTSTSSRKVEFTLSEGTRTLKVIITQAGAPS